MKELKDLVAGDEVLVTGMFHRHIAKVDKVTKTQIIVNNARFRRDSGWQCGSDRWNVCWIASIIPERNCARYSGMIEVRINPAKKDGTRSNREFVLLSMEIDSIKKIS